MQSKKIVVVSKNNLNMSDLDVISLRKKVFVKGKKKRRVKGEFMMRIKNYKREVFLFFFFAFVIKKSAITDGIKI